MKKFRLIVVASFALVALGAVLATSASAAVSFLPAHWTFNGITVTTSLPTEATGELTLESNGIQVLCSGILVGTVGNEGSDTTTELLSLTLVKISTVELSGTALECEDHSTSIACEHPLVWAANLPWQTLAELMVDGPEELFVDLLISGAGGLKPGWYVECMDFIPLTNLCEGEGINQLLNLTGDVGAEFSEAFTELAELLLATCTSGGEDSGIVESDAEGLIADTEAGTLQVAS